MLANIEKPARGGIPNWLFGYFGWIVLVVVLVTFPLVTRCLTWTELPTRRAVTVTLTVRFIDFTSLLMKVEAARSGQGGRRVIQPLQ